MKQNRNGGYSLIEILLAIVLLGAIMVPTCTSLVMSIKINDRTDEMMQAQLAVSSAVETLMAEGIYKVDGTAKIDSNRFPDVEIKPTDNSNGYFSVTVSSTIVESVIVNTSVREVPPPTTPETEPEAQQGGGAE